MKSFVHQSPRWLAALCVILLLSVACSEDPGEEANQEENVNNQNGENGEPQVCDVESWQCAEYEDGFALSIRRHGHHTFMLDDGLALLYGGSERAESHASSRAESWEVVDVHSGEIVKFEEFEEQRRNPSVVQLDSKGVLAIGGIRVIGSGTLHLDTVQYFHPPSLSWTPAPDMREAWERAVKLSDGDVLAMSTIRSGGAHHLDGQIFDVNDWSWTDITSAELPHDGIDHTTFAPTADGRVVVAYRYLAPEEMQPEEEEFDLWTAAAAIFDPGSGDLVELQEFDEIYGLELLLDVTELPMTEQNIIHLRPFDLEDELDTQAYLVDPSSDHIEELYVRDPPPGNPVTVFPGDEILYRSGTQMQRFDVPGDRWRNFGSLPDKIYYSSMVMLPDCTLFMSGERTLNAPNDELRLVDTGFCHPDLSQ